VNIKVSAELSRVLITKTIPCSFNQLYGILISTFICSLVQRVKDKDLASRHTKTKENLVEAVHRCREVLVSYNMQCNFWKKIRRWDTCCSPEVVWQLYASLIMVFVYIFDDVIKCFPLIKFESNLSYHQRIHVAHTHDSFPPGMLHLKTVWHKK
jgi:hypothetical protein